MSAIFIALEFTILFFFILYLVYQYSSKDAPLYVKITTFISWLLSFGIVAILPLDIFITLQNDPDSSSNVLEVIWNVLYWSTFLFTWLILPAFQEYEEAGEFTVKEKIKRSIYNNIVIYGVGLVCLIVFVVYLSLTSKFEEGSLTSFLIAMANSFGIFLIIMLLGYGLVALPRDHWQSRDLDKNLKFCYFQAVCHNDAKITTEFEFERLVQTVIVISKGCNKNRNQEFIDFVDRISNIIPKNQINLAQTTLSTSFAKELDSEFGEITMKKLITLNKKVIKGIAELKRAESKWENLLEESFLIEDILHNRNSINHRIRSTFWVERSGRLGSLIDKAEWFWLVKAKKWVNIGAAILFSIFSILVFLGQVTIFTSYDVSVFGNITKLGDPGFFQTQILTLIPLLYVMWAVYYGLFRIKVAGLYGLYRHHMTDGPSLLFYSLNISRVSAPLCFNFLQMIKIQNTAFNRVMGEVNIVPVFGGFTSFFPLMLIILCLFNLFNVYGKILSLIGLRQFQFADSFNDERIEEGKKLIDKARGEREKDLENSGNVKNAHGYSSQMRLRSHSDNDASYDGGDLKLSNKNMFELNRKKDLEKSSSGMSKEKQKFFNKN